MKIYISLPITGYPIEEVKARANDIKNDLLAQGHEVITPFDVCNVPGKSYSYYMGRDIEALLECDAIYKAPEWRKSKGCVAESQIA